jgi:hypothetical protein
MTNSRTTAKASELSNRDISELELTDHVSGGSLNEIGAAGAMIAQAKPRVLLFALGSASDNIASDEEAALKSGRDQPQCSGRVCRENAWSYPSHSRFAV